MEKKKENQETRTSYNPCLLRKKLVNKTGGITLIALVITIVLNCSYLAME